jgi:signal transduction histidine kinase
VNPTSFLRGGAYRLSLVYAAACVLSGVLLIATIYWQTKVFETKRIGAFVVMEANAISRGSDDQILWSVRSRTALRAPDEYNDVILVALFTPDRRPLAGNLEHLPPDLPADGRAHQVELMPSTDEHTAPQPIIAVARALADGRILLFGRGIRVLTTLEGIVAQALLLGAIPAIGLVIAAGIWLSRQAQWRVKAVNQSIERIMEGHVQERLPVQDTADDFDQLASSVNRMLAKIEGLLAEVQGVGDNIAHDLRTPLARVRTLLERGRDRARTLNELVAVTDRAIIGLDQAQSIITALLRIGEIEGGQRKSGFGDVNLTELVQEAGELYGPMAEAKPVHFEVRTDPTESVDGDRDLLIEAIANLLDNAIKFTPPGGTVRLQVTAHGDGPVVSVSDTGPGIAPGERAAVMKRFYRIDKSRNVKGSGLGLSIVLAIIKLHDFSISVSDAQPGCCFEIFCYARRQPEAATARGPVLRRLASPMKRSTRDRRGEADSGGWNERRVRMDAVSDASD